MKIFRPLLFIASILSPSAISAQCIASTNLVSYSAAGGYYVPQQMFSCAFADDFISVQVPAGIWNFYTSISTDFITITTTSNVVLASGTGTAQLLNYAPTTVRMHIFADSTCAVNAFCRVPYVQRQYIPVPVITSVDSQVCASNTTATLVASNLFGSATFWYAESCGSTPIDSGSTITVTPDSTTTYYAANQFNNNLSNCDSFTLTVNPNPVPSFSIIANVACFGDSTGALQASATSGSSPYSFLWSNNETTPNIIDLDTGTYSVTITDANNCTDSLSYTITQPAALSSAITVTSEPLCSGDNTGAMEVSVSGGVTPYMFQWSNGSNSFSANNLPAGQYNVIIIDSNGCTLKDSAIITEPTNISLVVSNKTPVDCHGNLTGQLGVVAFGGSGNLSFLWNTGAIAASLSNLSAGTYTVSVTDENNCERIFTDTITEPAAFSGTFTSIPAFCHDSENGVLSFSPIGATPPFNYAWSNGGTGNELFGLDTGTYVLSITDANGCNYADTAFVDYTFEDPIVPIDDSVKLCSGFEIILDAGNIGSTYLWSTGAMDQTVAIDSGGLYSLAVTDTNGCSTLAFIRVVEELCLGVTENKSIAEVVIYPNPSTGEINLVRSLFTEALTKVHLMDLTGSLVGTYTLRDEIKTLDLRTLPRGMYLLHIVNGSKLESHRIVLQ